jgi:hypothetical protein
MYHYCEWHGGEQIIVLLNLDGKPHFRAIYDIYTVTRNELKTVLNMSAQAGQSGVVNTSSVELTDQDDFQKVKRRNRHISNYTSQIAKKSAKPVPASTAVNLPLRTVLTRKFLAPVRTTDMDTARTWRLLAQRIHYRNSRLPENHVGRYQ